MDSIRGFVSRLVAGCAASVAAVIALSGCAEQVGGISATCTQPETLNDGFFADRSIFFRVSTQTHPTDPRTTWVCFRVKVEGQTDTAGRIDINPTAGTTGSEVTADTNSRSCAVGPANLVPGPHPIQEGAVLDVPFYFDAYAGDPLVTNDGVALCVEVGSIKQRVVVPLPGVQLPAVTARTDPSPPAPQDTTPPPAGKASSSCSGGAYGTPRELINAHLARRDLYLVTAQPNQTELHVCARLSGQQQSGGGRLSVNAAPGQIVRIEQSPDTSPCTQNVVTLSNPPMAIALTPTGQNPPSVCVSGTRYTVVTGPIPPVVSWTADT